MSTTIKEGSTLKAKHFADGDILMRSGSNLVSLTRAELKAIIAAGLTDGTIPFIQNGRQLEIAADGTVSAPAAE